MNLLAEIEDHVSAIDFTTIDLCLNVYWWARFCYIKAGVNMHTLFDIERNVFDDWQLTLDFFR